jgi:hypothetical protein
MLSGHLKWARTPPGGVHPGEQSALAGRRGPQELLIGKCMPGSTALAGHRNRKICSATSGCRGELLVEHRGLQELLIGMSNHLAV